MPPPSHQEMLDQLAGRVRELLPPEWREAFRFERNANALLLRIESPAAGTHHLDVRRLEDAGGALVQSERLAFSYLQVDASSDAHAPQYRAVLQQLLPLAPEFEALLAAPFGTALPVVEPRSSEPLQQWGATSNLNEFTLWRAHRTGSLRSLIDSQHPRGDAGQVHLYLENLCDQACEFCEQSTMPRWSKLAVQSLVQVSSRLHQDIVSTGALDALLELLVRHDPPLQLTVTGNDWTRHPARDALLERLEREPRVRVSFLGPNTALADPALVARLKRLPALGAVAITLLGATPDRHDAVTRTPGSHQNLMQAMTLLRDAGVPLQLHTVLTRTVVDGLGELLQWLAAEGLETDLLGFVPDRTRQGWDGDRLMAPVSQLRQLLERHLDVAMLSVRSLISVPVCDVPEALRSRLKVRSRGAKSLPPVFAPACEGCSARLDCSGLTEVYFQAHGERGLAPA